MELPHPARERASRQDYPEAAAELEWLFGRAEAELGFHAQTYESDRFCAFEVDGMHEARATPRYREAAAKFRRVRPLYENMNPELRLHARLAYETRQWPAAFQVAFAAGRGLCLAGLAAVTPIASRRCAARHAVKLEAWRKHEEARKETGAAYSAPPQPESPLVWLLFEVGKDGTGNKKLVTEIMQEARRLLVGALAEYDALRLERDTALGLTREVG